EIRNKFVSWTLNVVKEIKEIPAKNNSTPGNVYGVGINLALVQPIQTSSPPYNRVGVDSVEPNGPASKSGLRSGDVIVEVDGRRFDDGRAYLPDDVAGAIRGPEGSQVGVVVERGGKERVTFVLTREPIGVVAGCSPPASPAREVREKPKEVTAQSKGLCEKQGKEKRQVGNQREAISHETKQSENQAKKDATCEGRSKSENEKVTTAKATSNIPDNLESLTLSEEEHKEKDLADSDQFDDTRGCCNLLGNVVPLMHSNSIDEISEEKMVDNNEEISSIINSVGGGDNEWELISERSGSAIVVSFSGSMSGASFRSASPSVLKNKFVLTESTGEPYIDHVVLPTDTLQGLCLAYKISATRLRMENSFSGNSLQMAPKKLKIPTLSCPAGMMIRTQDKTSHEFKLYAFVAEIPTMELVEAKAYLDLSSWNLDEALRSAREDEGWSLKGGFEANAADTTHELTFDSTSPMMIAAVAKPKALTAHDIYAAPPPFEGDGFELKDIKQK
ncbi:hypothetical protein ACHAXR_007890, partial [Thalassiosira sp. AJA248-18]